ncbi:MAG: hypothetical protein JSV03_01860 [Planctomycetota bacterium]|nr:MAG: hypothetical protein JSV03_01860 [Planctomycetota bacterium]
MNPREKFLIVFLAIFGLLAVGRTVKRSYEAKIDGLDDKISSLVKKDTIAKAEKRRAVKGINEWFETGMQTISTDLNQTKERLRDKLNELASKSGMGQAIIKLNQKEDKVGKNGVKALEFRVTSEGRLQQVVQFLFNIHRQHYLVRCTHLEIGLVSDKKKQGQLKMDAHFETLILPSNKTVPAKMIETKLAQTKPAEVPDRLAFASLNDYQKSIKPELFEAFKPTPRPRPTTVQRPTGTGPKPPSPPKPPPPPPDSELALRRILSSPRGQQVVLEDERNKNAEDKRVEVGETLYGGTLVFVHPTGAVSDKQGQWRFHPMGLKLKECKPLTKEDYPAVFHELSKLQQRSGGITKGPG